MIGERWHQGEANPSMDCTRRLKWRRVLSITGHTYGNLVADAHAALIKRFAEMRV
jgi:hypothetical protein